MVEKDNGKLLCAGDTEKNCAKTGIIGCTQYSDEKIAKPARNKENRTAINCFEP
jgi:hypothetical protein